MFLEIGLYLSYIKVRSWLDKSIPCELFGKKNKVFIVSHYFLFFYVNKYYIENTKKQKAKQKIQNRVAPNKLHPEKG